MRKIFTYHGSNDALVWMREKRALTSDTEVIVPISHEVIFVKQGKMTDNFTLGRYVLSECAVGEGHLFASPGESVDCQIYYVKKEGTYNIKWQSEKPVCLTDPVLKIPVELEISGAFGINIINTKQFLSRLLTFTKKVALEEVKAFFRERMLLYVKDELLHALTEENISVIELPRKLMTISKRIELRVRYLFESFGVSVVGFMIKKAELISGGAKCVPAIDATKKEELTGQNNAGNAPQPGEAKGEQMYCPKCGHAVPPLSVYCFKCGEKLVNSLER